MTPNIYSKIRDIFSHLEICYILDCILKSCISLVTVLQDNGFTLELYLWWIIDFVSCLSSDQSTFERWLFLVFKIKYCKSYWSKVFLSVDYLLGCQTNKVVLNPFQIKSSRAVGYSI